MPKPIRLSHFVSVGHTTPSLHDLDWLRAQGFRSVFDLRTADDAGALLPDQEAAAAADRGLTYARLPVPAAEMDDALLDRFGAVLRELPKPVFVHCTKGRRAGMFALTQVALEQGMPGRTMLRTARDMGLLYGSSELQQRFAEYVDRRAAEVDPLARREDVLHRHLPPEPVRHMREDPRRTRPTPSVLVPDLELRPGEQADETPSIALRQDRLVITTVALGVAGIIAGMLIDRRLLLVPLTAAGIVGAGLLLAGRGWAATGRSRPQEIESRTDEVELLSRRLRELQAV